MNTAPRGKTWELLPPAPASYFQTLSPLPPLIAQLLYNRHILDSGPAQAFLQADSTLMVDPLSIPDMGVAVARLGRALHYGETIGIFGDFDADGVCSAAVLAEGLERLGAKPLVYIPNRVNEGHGLNLQALESLHHSGAALVVTADCGVTGYDEVQQAAKLGMEVIVTDHHTVPERLPPAVAVVDPERPDSLYSHPHLAGVGVAFKLLQALYQDLGEKLPEDLLELVALGTIADQVPLVGENRYFAKRGLELLNRTRRPGIEVLIRRAGLQPGKLDTDSILFALAPRLNATGRLDYATPSYRILRATTPQEASGLAEVLEGANALRQGLTERCYARALEKLAALGDLGPILVVGDADFPVGVVGLVASKLAEEFYRPAVVMSLGEEVVHGSARSVPEFDLMEALTACADLFLRFGGHSQAAGFTMASSNLRPLEQRLLDIAQARLAGQDLHPRLVIDLETPLSSLNGATWKLMQRMAPFGKGNPSPTFLSRGVNVMGLWNMGAKGDHLRLKLKDRGVVWQAVGFGLGPMAQEATPQMDIVYSLGVNNWGQEVLELQLQDLAPAGRRSAGR